jgi:ribonuclease HI
MKIDIYTDGGCKPNPGYGACAIVVVKDNEVVYEKAYKKDSTTNNRMELSAMIIALGYVRDKIPLGTETYIHSDSQYVQKGITLWMQNWKRNSWKTATKKDVVNKDLWLRIDELVLEILALSKYVEYSWVKGHSDSVYNNRVDALCTNIIMKYT